MTLTDDIVALKKEITAIKLVNSNILKILEENGIKPAQTEKQIEIVRYPNRVNR